MVSGAAENWMSRGVYATICRLYRIEPPFYENRRLSQRDFKAIESEFVSRVGPRELHRRQRQPSKGLPPSERHLQAHTVFDKIHDYMQAHCVGMTQPTGSGRGQARVFGLGAAGRYPHLDHTEADRSVTTILLPEEY